ncbi:MAG: hypothetical protein DRI90_25045 [Deltaproteobacteria bacterium]|nr:MAG: hypothetical protein DRI90_25045 [Deltaproteobacteria bacterium]
MGWPLSKSSYLRGWAVGLDPKPSPQRVRVSPSARAAAPPSQPVAAPAPPVPPPAPPPAPPAAAPPVAVDPVVAPSLQPAAAIKTSWAASICTRCNSIGRDYTKLLAA